MVRNWHEPPNVRWVLLHIGSIYFATEGNRSARKPLIDARREMSGRLRFSARSPPLYTLEIGSVPALPYVPKKELEGFSL